MVTASASAVRATTFMVMTKPELAGASESVLAGIERLLSSHGVAIERRTQLKGPKLSRTIRLLYPRLHLVSASGLRGAGPHARKAVELFTREKRLKTMSACSFLRFRPEMTPGELRTIGDRVGCVKFGSGVYGFVTALAELVLNPFAPAYFSSFDLPDMTVTALQCRSDRSWRDLRENVIGSIDVERAKGSSLRAWLWRDQVQLKLPAISLASNGIHFSPGPLEARWQLGIAFDDPDMFPWKGKSRKALLAWLEHFEENEDADFIPASMLRMSLGDACDLQR